MKKSIILIILLLIPFIVNAEECDSEKITIESISLENKTDNVEELNEATVDGKNISFDLNMSNVGDNAEYKLVIKNESDEDYEIDNGNLDLDSDYFKYTINTEDNSNIVEAKSSKNIYLKIQYENEIDESNFENNKYNDNKKMTISLVKGEVAQPSIVELIKNPNTRDGIILLALICITCMAIMIYAFIKNNREIKTLIILLALTAPIYIRALCKCEIVVNSQIEITKEEPTPTIQGYLMSGSSSDNTNNFLRTSIKKKDIEKITFADSLDNHEANGTDCWDVSKESNGAVLIWAEDEDSDGLYEMTIGADGQVYSLSGLYLFYDLSNLTSIEGMENWNTSQMTTAYMLFYKCSKLTTIDLSHFDTSNITTMAYMFDNCSGLTSLDVSGFDTSKVTDMSYMFHNNNKLTEIDVSNFITDNVTNFAGMFMDDLNLAVIDVSNFNTESATRLAQMFSGCKAITSLDLSNFITNKVTDMSAMFDGCSKLVNLNISSFNTAKVSNMSHMFRNCQVLPSLDLSHFDTARVTDMSHMFYGDSKLSSLNVTSFNTEKVTDMSYMFEDCTGLTSLDVSNFNTDKVTNMSFMFSNCNKLTTLNLENFNTENVTNINDMFSNCKSLTTLNVSSFKTSKVIYMNNVFENCENLVTLDISNFSSTSVQYTKNMFSGCKKLTTIYTSNDLDFTSLDWSSSSSMFYNDTKLRGGSGTTYSSSSYDASRARVDGGTSSPGYFTLKQ